MALVSDSLGHLHKCESVRSAADLIHVSRDLDVASSLTRAPCHPRPEVLLKGCRRGGGGTAGGAPTPNSRHRAEQSPATVRCPRLGKGDRSTRWRARWLALNPARGHELGTRWVGKKSPRCTHEALPPQPLTPGAGDCISPRAQAMHRWHARAVAASSPSPSTPAPLGPARPATAAASRKGEPGAPRGRGFMSVAAPSSRFTDLSTYVVT